MQFSVCRISVTDMTGLRKILQLVNSNEGTAETAHFLKESKLKIIVCCDKGKNGDSACVISFLLFLS